MRTLTRQENNHPSGDEEGNGRVSLDCLFALVARQLGGSSAFLDEKRKQKVDQGQVSPQAIYKTLNSESSVDAELLGYIKKGKRLIDDYLKTVFWHLTKFPMEDLGQKVSKLIVTRDFFVGRVVRLQEMGLQLITISLQPIT